MNRNLTTARFDLIQRTDAVLQANVEMTNTQLRLKYNFNSDKDAIDERSRSVRLLNRSTDEYILWDIFDKESNLIVGNLGFHNILMKHKRSEIGYWCQSEWRRKGIVSESLTEVIRYGFQELSLNRIEAFLDVDNKASENVLLKCNFSKEGLLREHYIDHDKVCDSYVYSLLKSDYLTINK